MGGAAQKPLFSTGSFTGAHSESPLKIGFGYLSADTFRRQPLCGNKEGWGPLSPHRYDFTPCFMDVWVASVAAFGIVGGAIAIWWLVKKKNRFEVARDWHFWTKQV
jgi:ATP-binding cassette subfamily C (CFTR/MRP) protein 1